jgi:pimeloyl-ACP methyl ester carboxylesterase
MKTTHELVTGTPREQTRARYPDEEGFVERDGVRTFYEVYGSGDPSVLLLPTWSIVHSRLWKMQIPYLARHCRIVTFDGRGNGRSDRPEVSTAYSDEEFARDALAVLDATGTRSAALVSESSGAKWALLLAAEHAERVASAIFIAPALPLGPVDPALAGAAVRFDEQLESHDGWEKFNRHYWLEHYRDFLEFFFAQCFTEAHSTKQIEDCIGWALETAPESLVATMEAADRVRDADAVREFAAKVSCPTLVIHGTDDAVRPVGHARELARLTGGRLFELDGSGHVPEGRDPVKVNQLVRDFVAPRPPLTGRWPRGRARRKRALYVSSPIGLGHARRDVAIANELRKLQPELEVDWLAQHPVTAVLEASGERIHPASASLSNESAHMVSESGEHDLHCFQAWRRVAWTRSCSRTSWSSSISSARSSTTFGSGTRPGSSTTTCTRTRSRRPPPTSG